jgi:hypothetical protein
MAIGVRSQGSCVVFVLLAVLSLPVSVIDVTLAITSCPFDTKMPPAQSSLLSLQKGV